MTQDYTVGKEENSDELHILIENYDLCVFNVEPLFDVDGQSRITDEDDGYVVPPSTFTLRVYNHHTIKDDLEFCWDGIWLTNLSQGWKMHLGPDNGGLIQIGDESGATVH